jgi:general secretion pathway protein J
MAHSKPSGGFTLIEVLIAMTLLGIMVVLLFSSMKISADSWQKGEDKITQVNDVAVVYQFFQHHLAIAKPLWKDFAEDSEQTFSFQGKSQELQFVSSFPASAKRSGLQLFSLNLINDGGEQVIQVSITPFFPVAEGEEWLKEEVVLLRHVRDFSLSYYGLDETQTEGVWQEDWIEQETLPRLVKIKIARDDGNFWPEMIVELKSQAMQSDLDDDGQTITDDAQAVEESIIENQGE